MRGDPSPSFMDKKIFPLLAVFAVVGALVGVAMTQGFGAFNSASTTQTCLQLRPGAARSECIRKVQEKCKELYPQPQSPERAACVRNGIGNVGATSAKSVKSKSRASRSARSAPSEN